MNGITAICSPGHTPGHTGFLVHSGRDGLIFWGDTVHIQSIQVPRPDITMVFDTDQDDARKSRITMFERVVVENLAIAGAHVDFPGFGRLVRRGTGYALEQDG
jgi:glyoxylase-like metal-dependent hydrolase (beta-lactamase superfamily II)